MSEEINEELQNLFQDFLLCPDSEYPWNIYEKWNEVRNKAKEYEPKDWKDLVYDNSICSARGDGAVINDLDQESLEKIKVFVEKCDKETFQSLQKNLTNLFNKGRNKQASNFEARINRIASIFDNECSFIPSVGKFKSCCGILKEKCQLQLKKGSWLEMNAELNEKLKPLVSNTGSDGTNDPRKDKIFLLKAFPTWVQFSSNRIYPTEDSPNVIFYGAPGTGKTYHVKEYLKKKFEDNYEEHVCWVQFHPSYSYEDFIEGIKPIGISNESVNLKLVNGKFKNFCKKAKGNLSEEYYFVADEINRANLSAVFGETLSLLESGYRDFRKIENDAKEQRHLIETQYSELERNSANSEIFYEEEEKYKGKFGVPRNIRFIGMMNDVDKSIDAFDLALRRRFKWVRMDCDYSVIRDNIVLGNVDKFIISCAKLNYCISGCEPKESQGLSDEDMQKVKQDVSSKLELGASFEFGHANFLKIKDVCRQNSIKKVHKEELFDGYLKPTLKEYLRSLCPEEGKLEKKLSDARNVFVKEIVEKNPKQ
ncbi:MULTISPECIES: McrB family protein [unclassified Fibrobacter]|uniref:McrB family protein n=1 Tax=unclassified Fibrobacter TaxID=2634177 RepID=UPI00091342D9|nr:MULTISPECIES: AAA family ATPase [unclassified Fibrobacter]SHM74044.1 AAA domain (dynein-related subfamily) [Fibrobacter sp. UWB7]SMG31671.1 AAA domain (dynein-related subfamily) [Fibrobacter sp. UWB13]